MRARVRIARACGAALLGATLAATLGGCMGTGLRAGGGEVAGGWLSHLPPADPQAPKPAYFDHKSPFVRASLARSMDAIFADSAGAAPAPDSAPLSPGDRVRVLVHESEEFSGSFVIETDGSLRLPYLEPLLVAGRDVHAVERALIEMLVQAGFHRTGTAHVSVRTVQLAPVRVTVSGAVFDPGSVTINADTPEERVAEPTRQAGDHRGERDLMAALRAAGGVRPDADLSRVMLIREGTRYTADISGALDGTTVSAVPLASGDRLMVPSTGVFRTALVRPSQVTPPGVRVYISNLTKPASSNANSAVSREATRLPYGTRLLTATISGNCVGGTRATNASRYAVLVSTNPITGRPEVVEREVDALLHHPDNVAVNPPLMPGDGVACYDSDVTGLRDIARTVAELLLPFILL